MKVIPIQGLEVAEPIIIPVRVYTPQDLSIMFNLDIKSDYNKIYLDNFIFVDKSKLNIAIKNSVEIHEILDKFKNIRTFAIINVRNNKLTEFYDLRVSLSIIYIAYRFSNGRNTDFFKQILTSFGYFTKDSKIISTYWDVKIGSKPVDDNDFDVSLPVYYTLDDYPESWRIQSRINYKLTVDTNIELEIQKLYSSIIKRNDISQKLRSAFNLLFYTFNFNNLDVIIPIYATILETLLLSKNESSQRKKVSVRSACMIGDSRDYKAKEYIANWVYYFYEYRNNIVHDGKSYIEFQLNEPVVFNHVMSFIQQLIFNLIRIIVNNDIDSIENIIDIVTSNGKKDGLANNFDYITKNRIMYYEEN